MDYVLWNKKELVIWVRAWVCRDLHNLRDWRMAENPNKENLDPIWILHTTLRLAEALNHLLEFKEYCNTSTDDEIGYIVSHWGKELEKELRRFSIDLTEIQDRLKKSLLRFLTHIRDTEQFEMSKVL